MKICPKCKKIYDDSEATCSDCRKKLKNIENKNTPVGVCKVSGVDRMRVHAALEDAGIPSGEQRVKSKVSAEAITGGDLSDVIITVPYQAYDKALDICIGIGVVDDDTIDEKTKEDIESKKEQYDKDIGTQGRSGVHGFQSIWTKWRYVRTRAGKENVVP